MKKLNKKYSEMNINEKINYKDSMYLNKDSINFGIDVVKLFCKFKFKDFSGEFESIMDAISNPLRIKTIYQLIK